jgi:hypothetical protein
MTEILDLSNVISVSILGAPSGLDLPNINTVALFTTETPDPVFSDGYKIYTGPTEVGEDFGTDSTCYAMAVAFFAQQPNPLATQGYLVVIPREAEETTEEAIARTLNTVYYFGVLVDEAMEEAAFVSLTAYIQTLDKMFFYASALAADYAPGGMLDDLRTAGKTHSRGLFYNDGDADDTLDFAAAYASRGLSTNFAGSLTTQTLHLKSLANFVPDPTINQTELAKVQTAGVDVYVNMAGISCLFTAGANGFFDEVYNEFWFKFALQVAGFNYLRQTNTKIPQTEIGMEGLKNAYRAVCAQAVSNGFVGPGSWTSPDVFGNPASLIRNISDIGFYVWSLPITEQNQNDRENRIAPLVQIAIKAQGAVHKSNVIVNVNL